MKAGPADLLLHADENLVYQVLANLTVNAMHAVEGMPAPRVILSAHVNAEDNVVL